jgi:hypothetical protein
MSKVPCIYCGTEMPKAYEGRQPFCTKCKKAQPIEVSTPPAHSDLRRFIEVVDLLAEFESKCFMARGFGVFDRKKDLPDPAVTRVMGWLNCLASDNFRGRND